MQISKLRSLFIVTLLVGLMLVLGGTLVSAQAAVQIWVPWGGADGDYYAAAAAEYSAATGVPIEVTVVSGAGIAGESAGRLATAVNSGEAPDAVIYWGAGDIPGLVTAGTIQPLAQEQLDAVGITPDIFLSENVWAAGQYDGQVYALPQLMYNRVFYWNKDLFAAAGLDPEVPPTTLEELDAMAQQLTTFAADGSIDVLGFLPWAGQGYPDVWTAIFGGSFWDADAQAINLQNPALTSVVQWYASYVEQYGADALTNWSGTVGELGQSSGGEPFVLGKLAMEINGNWHINFVRQFNPELNFGVAPIPQAPGGQPNATMVGANIWLFPYGAAQVDEALKFIAWLYEPERAAANADALANISHIAAGAAAQTLNDDTFFAISIDLASSPAAVFAPIFPNGNLVGNALNPQIDLVKLGQATPEDALAQAQADLEFAILQGGG
ncbi:MAG: extracellular solute-binding protein [Chloroflexi bacterium]|uniref:extracellular solute-binding protein n=1 Tax=Candidatus Flexifilum breve TaxID=3140694 RepID=UPI003135DF20|nr:extracellular solute-binding protein [Chloroflexota bacterium]